MRLIRQNIERDGSGSVTLYPEDPEDMWAAYNLIRAGDLLRASAIRRVTTESSTGTTSSHRVHLTLTVRVRSTSFDSAAAQLHVSGQIAEETPHAKRGQYHTLDLELNRNFTLIKETGEGGWDSVAVQLVKDACNADKGASAWAVVMAEGSANLAVLMGERTVLRQRVAVPVPGKKAGEKAHAKALERFFEVLRETLLRHLDLENSEKAPLPILLASPGYTATQFKDYLLSWAARSGSKFLLPILRQNLLVVHSSTGHLHSLPEILASPSVLALLSDTRYARETSLLDQFMALLRKDDGRAWYGAREVEKAVAAGAVGRGGGVLMISDSLFRAEDVAVRKKWVALVDYVRGKEGGGGEVRVLSSEHESGRRLDALGGVAALLTFPLDGLDDESDDGEGEEETGGENGNRNGNLAEANEDGDGGGGVKLS